jgi:hypothetical protein
MVPKPVSDTRVAMGRLAIIVTVCAWLAYTVLWFFSDFFHPGYESAVARTEEVLYLVIVTLLTVSALAYLLARLGFMYRTRTHHRATRASLDQYYDARRPTLTTIIPCGRSTGTGSAARPTPRPACSPTRAAARRSPASSSPRSSASSRGTR